MRKLSSYRLALLIMVIVLISACKNTTPKNEEPIAVGLSIDAQNCMEQVIATDASFGEIRNHACETISLSETIKEYTAEIETYDFQDCPEAFTVAFKKHQSAWKEMLSVTDAYPDLRGEMHELFKIMETGNHAEAFGATLQKIQDTWTEVENAMN